MGRCVLASSHMATNSLDYRGAFGKAPARTYTTI